MILFKEIYSFSIPDYFLDCLPDFNNLDGPSFVNFFVVSEIRESFVLVLPYVSLLFFFHPCSFCSVFFLIFSCSYHGIVTWGNWDPLSSYNFSRIVAICDCSSFMFLYSVSSFSSSLACRLHQPCAACKSRHSCVLQFCLRKLKLSLIHTIKTNYKTIWNYNFLF